MCGEWTLYALTIIITIRLILHYLGFFMEIIYYFADVLFMQGCGPLWTMAEHGPLSCIQ